MESHLIDRESQAIDFSDTNQSGIYQVTIIHTKGWKEIWNHITPDFSLLSHKLFKGEIRSFEVTLDYT